MVVTATGIGDHKINMIVTVIGSSSNTMVAMVLVKVIVTVVKDSKIGGVYDGKCSSNGKGKGNDNGDG